MTKAGIYQILNIGNGHRYVGGSIEVPRRLSEHRSMLRRDTHFNRHLQFAWNKYGEDSFEVEQILTCHPNMVEFYEQQFIDQWKPEYNLSPTAMTTFGYKHSEETRRKNSLARKGKPLKEETKKKLKEIQRGEGNGFFGWKHTDETKARMRAAKLGRKLPDWMRKRMSERSTGSGNQAAKLDETKVEEIRELLKTNRQVDVAKIYGVARQTIYDIDHNKSWVKNG